MKYPEINGIYQHYKGGKYQVISMAKHSETDETLVIYKSIHWGSYHARPLEVWNGTVGEQVDKHGTIEEDASRFKFIGYSNEVHGK